MNIHSTFINKSPKLETNHLFTNKNMSKNFWYNVMPFKTKRMNIDSAATLTKF